MSDSEGRIPTADLREVLTRIEDKVDRSCASAERAANLAFRTHEDVKDLRLTSDAHHNRIRRLELRDTWLPVVLSSVSTLVAVAALVTVILRGGP